MNEQDSFDSAANSERAESALGRIRDWLGRNDWSWDEAEDGSYIRTGVQGKNARFRLIIGVRGEGPVFLTFAIYDFLVPSARRPACSDLINRINFTSLLGAFEMDVDDGELRFRITFPLDEAEITDAQIERTLVVASMMADRFYPCFMSLVHAGFAPAEAINSADTVN